MISLISPCKPVGEISHHHQLAFYSLSGFIVAIAFRCPIPESIHESIMLNLYYSMHLTKSYILHAQNHYNDCLLQEIACTNYSYQSLQLHHRNSLFFKDFSFYAVSRASSAGVKTITRRFEVLSSEHNFTTHVYCMHTIPKPTSHILYRISSVLYLHAPTSSSFVAASCKRFVISLLLHL